MELRLGGARAEREEHGLAAARRRGTTGEEPRGPAVEREHGREGARGEGAAATVLCARRNRRAA